MMANSDASSSNSDFTFINVGSSQLRGDDETRRRIRSHAQAYYRRRTSNKKQPATIDLDISHLIDGPGSATSGVADALPLGRHSPRLLVPEPSTILDASRTDPFGTFDIGDSRRARHLWDHAYEGLCPKFRALHGIGFMDLARETIALPSLLSASAWHLVHALHYEQDQGDDAKFSIKTAQSLQQRLDSPTTSTSDEVVITVLALAAYSNLTKDLELFDVHFNGLRQIFRLRVYNDFLNSSSALRLGLFWIETNGRFRVDAAPEYPQPNHLLAAGSKLSFPFPALDQDSAFGTQENLVENAIVPKTWNLLRHLNQIITEELLTGKDLWHDVTFAVYHLTPILHSFLTIPRASVRDDLSFRQRECFRLACILYIANLQRKFDPEPGTGMLYASKLKLVLDIEDTIPLWSMANPLYLWILTVAACSSCLYTDLRNYFIARLQETLQADEGAPVQVVQDILNGAIWCREAFQEGIDALINQSDLHL